MSFAVRMSPRAARRVGGRLLPLVALAATLAAGLSPADRADAAPGGSAWKSSVTGLAIRGISSLRITGKSPELWYANIYGPKKARGICESASKGTKAWVVRAAGLDEATSERDTWRLTIDPKDDKAIYAVGRGKIYKTVNGGSAWESAGIGTSTFSFDRSQNQPMIAGVVVDPTNSKRLLAGTLSSGFFGGIFETKDGAKSWTQIAGTSTGERKDLEQSGLGDNAWPLSLDKSSDKYILVGGPTGSAWFSENHGVTFKSTQPGGPGIHHAYEMTQMIGRDVWLAESRGLWRSRDAGESWSKAPSLAGTCLSVDVDPGNRKIVYAIIEGKGLYRTENLQTWVGPLHPEIDAHEVVCHPHQKNTVLLCSRTTGLWISTDKGEAVAALAGQAPGDIPEVIPAITHVVAHPANPASWLAVTDTGTVFSSADRGSTWAKVGNLGAPIRRLIADPRSAGSWIVAGSGVFASTDGGAKWAPLYVPADPEERVADLQRLEDGSWLALLEREARVVASHDGGKTWDKDGFKRRGTGKSGWASQLAVDPRDPKHLLMATRTTAERWTKEDKDGGPLESKDGGATWTLLDAGFKSDKAVPRDNWNRGSVCGIDASHGTLFYGADGAGLFTLTPAADPKDAVWTEAALTGAPARPTFNAFLLTPNVPDVALATTIVVQVEGLTARAMLESIDGGKTFVASADPGAKLVSLSEDPGLRGRWLSGDPVGDRGVLSFDPVTGVPAIVPPTVPIVPPVVPVEAPKPPSGLVAFTGGKDKLVTGWDLATGKAFDPKSAAPPETDEVLALSLSGDKARLFAGSADKSVYAYDGRTGAPQDRFLGHAAAVQSVVASADGKLVYAGDAAFAIHVWDAATTGGKVLGKLEGHTAMVSSLVLSKDGSRLYSGSADKSVRAWDTATRKELFAIPGHPGAVWAVALSPDGSRLFVAGTDASVRVYDAASGAPAGAWAVTATSVSGLAVSPEGSLLYVVGASKELVALGTGDGQAMFTYTGSASALTCVAVSDDGEWIVAGAEDGLLRAWKKGRADVAWTSAKVHSAAIHCLALASDAPAKPAAPAPVAPVPAAPAPTAPTPPAMGGDAPPPVDPGSAAPPSLPAPGMDAPPAPPAMAEPAMGGAPVAPAPVPQPTPVAPGK